LNSSGNSFDTNVYLAWITHHFFRAVMLIRVYEVQWTNWWRMEAVGTRSSSSSSYR